MYKTIIEFFSAEGLSPHWLCLYGRNDIITVHIVADILIAIAYFTIPAAIIYFVSKRNDISFKWMYILFTAFIISCGSSHIFGALTFWIPAYGAEAVVKFTTAILSVITAIAIWQLMPRVLAIPSRADLEAANKLLSEESSMRAQVQAELSALNLDLEARVNARTHELVVARMSAENANKSKSEFLTTMSHELRTPLSTILGFSELILASKHERTLSQRDMDYVQDIHESGAYLLSLINDILDVAKIETGKMEIEKIMIDIRLLISSVERLLAVRAVKEGVTLTHTIDDRIMYIYADQRAIKQILFNLISNAIKYTGRDGVVSVNVGQTNQNEISILVRDTGIGIAKSKLCQIGQPYEMVDNTYSGGENSTGLGLALVRGLVNLHAGTMKIESVVGKGTSVVVTIPQA